MEPPLPLQEVRDRRKTGSQDPRGPSAGPHSAWGTGGALPTCWGSGGSRPAPTSAGARPQSSPLQRSHSLSSGAKTRAEERRAHPSSSASIPSPEDPRDAAIQGSDLRGGTSRMQGSQDPMAAPRFPAKPRFPEGTLESLGFPASCVPALGGRSPGCHTGPLCPAHLPGAFPAPADPPYSSVLEAEGRREGLPRGGGWGQVSRCPPPTQSCPNPRRPSKP